MNPHNLHFDRRDWLDLLCGIPIMLSVFPVPLGLPISMVWFFFKDGCWPLPIIFFTWLAIGCYLLYLDSRDKQPPKWARKVFKT